MPSACVSLPGPEHRSSTRSSPRARAHRVEPVERLERADQHGGAHALRLADGVEHRVDAVGAVDVGAPGRPEQGRGARRQADVRVAGRLGLVVGLGLDDHAGGVAVANDAADEVARHLEHRTRRRSRAAHAAAASSSAARAAASCSRTRASAVPPSRDLRLEPRALGEHGVELVVEQPRSARRARRA